MLLRKLHTVANKWFSKRKPSEDNQTLEDKVVEFSFENLTKEQFDMILKFGKPCNRIGNYESKPFIELPFGIVKKELPLYQKQDKIFETIDLILGCQYEKLNFRRATGNELMSFLLWIRDQQDFLDHIESTNLSSNPDPKMAAAGIAQLDVMGILPIIDALAGGDILKYEAIEKLPYYKVYEKLKLNKINRDIDKRYQEIIKNTNNSLL